MTRNSKKTRLGVIKEQGTSHGAIELVIIVRDLFALPFLNIGDLGDGDRGSEIRFLSYTRHSNDDQGFLEKDQSL